MIEINPFILTEEGELYALECDIDLMLAKEGSDPADNSRLVAVVEDQQVATRDRLDPV